MTYGYPAYPTMVLVHLPRALHNGGMAVSKPGPKPEYTERFIVQLRPEQRQALDHISYATSLPISRLIRWFIDNGVHAFENTPTFKTLPRKDR